MSRPTLRFVLGTSRRRVSAALRRLRGRSRRRPPSPRVVPRPTRVRRTDPSLHLSHVLVASDLNPRYLDFWPLLARAWTEIVGVEALLVVVADPAETPPELREDKRVHVFSPLANVHTAFQAQCIRLLYPALVDGDGVLVSDMDMVPLSARYFLRPTTHVRLTDFVAYRDAYLHERHVPICYNAALPSTWGRIFGVESLDDVRTRLADWSGEHEYGGVHGGAGWGADQEILYRSLIADGLKTRAVWILDDDYTGFRRLERNVVEKRGGLRDEDRRAIAAGRYSDYHCLLPHSAPQQRGLNEEVVELAIGTRQRPLRRTT